MRLISLNIWGGRASEALAAFLREHASATDVFCFQEVIAVASGGVPALHAGPIGDGEPDDGRRRLSFADLEAILPELVGVFVPTERRSASAGALEFGLATFVRRDHEVRAWGRIPVLRHCEAFVGPGWQPLEGRPLQYCRLILGERKVLVANFHGTPTPGAKLDTPERLAQSRRIRDFLREEDGEVVLAGDFNLLPDTESIALLERYWRNLVREYRVTTTRSRLNTYYGTPEEQKYADYVFVSSGVAVSGFAVPDVAISDHLPLILDWT
ncbi:MAG: endonuclease/exonuclease/phosphatase family protein [Chloroflexi bacterium]|nr:endonuclease/exonuclease/phosphatase family protein [Chloroflexota bacterium]